jgi:lipopolysaccharide biosynthesis regulator YciM
VALVAGARGHDADAEAALQRAREAAPQAARPIVLAGQRLARQGRQREVLALWSDMLAPQPALFNLIASEFAECAIASGEQAAAMKRLMGLYQRAPTMDLLNAINLLDPDPVSRRERLVAHLGAQPALSAAHTLLRQEVETGTPLGPLATARVADALARAAKPLQRYRCAACGFEAQHYFWQCPGCLGWDTYPPQRLEDQ